MATAEVMLGRGPHGSGGEKSPPTSFEESDDSLMERIRLADAAAFRLLLERHWPGLIAYTFGIVGSVDAAEDVVQETFISIWRHRATWTSIGSVRAYLHKIARNLALNAVRAADAEGARRVRFGRDPQASGVPTQPDQEMAHAALREQIEAAIASLPAKRREVFILARYHGLSYQEIAETMGIANQTVANQMTAALNTLRDLLAPHSR